ncbi:50S ribosomal protein L2, partial [Candidatus Peregrinibacteria bacterium CG_4_9_14_0_2_um_filter_38_9]
MSSFEEITKSKPEKSLTVTLKKHSGRNNLGRITVRHRGGGTRTRYRMIDFNRTDKLDIEGIVKTVEYDPNRTSRIMLVQYVDGEKRYHLAPDGIKVEDRITCKEKGKIKDGNRMMLKNIPVGYNVYEVELQEGLGGQLGRSAGAAIKLVSLEGTHAQIQMPSGETRLTGKTCYAT